MDLRCRRDSPPSLSRPTDPPGLPSVCSVSPNRPLLSITTDLPAAAAALPAPNFSLLPFSPGNGDDDQDDEKEATTLGFEAGYV